MPRLSKGAKVIGRVIRSENGVIELCLTEVNGVAITLSSVDITVRKANRFTGFISYYIWKVPKDSQAKYSKAIEPVQICGESRKIKLDMKRSGKGLGDYILGSDIDAVAVLKGYDEIGRAVSVKVGF